MLLEVGLPIDQSGRMSLSGYVYLMLITNFLKFASGIFIGCCSCWVVEQPNSPCIGLKF